MKWERCIQTTLFLLGLMEAVGCAGNRPPCPTSLHWVDRIEGDIIVWESGTPPKNVHPLFEIKEGDAFSDGQSQRACALQKRQELQKRRDALERVPLQNSAL